MNALAELDDPVRREFFASQTKAWAGKFSWDSSAERLALALLSEVKRREGGNTPHRRPIDLATVASWPSGDVDDVERRLRKALRVTDTMLLTGCDEIGAAKALRRAQVSPAVLRLATTGWVLSGSGEDATV
jgi:hypothetical protein